MPPVETSPYRECSGSTMKNVLGKIFVFGVFVMSLMLMSFAVAIYSSHVNWQEVAKKKQEELDKIKAEEASLNQEITRLTANVASSEAARDQVIAKFQQALIEKDQELKKLTEARDEKLKVMQDNIADLATVEADLTRAREEVTKLQGQVRESQQKVDAQVNRAAEIAGQLHEKESFLEIANERKSQLEKQVAQARLLLKQNGLSLDSLPKDRVPTMNGVVMAVADDAIEVSLGFDDGLQTGHQIEVYRNDEYLGRAIVKSVKPDRAIAVLVREYSRGIVQRGDKVTTRLKA
jgi:septal ring factor EnvC (AmiA/AmiB activator)